MEEKKPTTLGEYFKQKEEEKGEKGRTLIDLLLEALKSKEESSKPKMVEAGLE